MTEVRSTLERAFSSHVTDEYTARVVNDAATHIRSDSWNSEAKIKDLDDLMATSFASSLTNRANANGQIAFVHRTETGPALVLLTLSLSGVSITSAAQSAGAAEDTIRHMHDRLPVATTEPKEKMTYVRFWSLGGRGPQSFRRKITVPTWDDIRENYTVPVQKELSELCLKSDGNAFKDGSLFLWQGEPGTGKTYALRALAREWRDWCDFHYITDPEKFFGGNVDYMLQVLLAQPEGDLSLEWEPDEIGPMPGMEENSLSRWKLLILEDSGEMLRQDAKGIVGQAFSRLLNTVDGMIGQGLQTLVLVTTNEELHDLHPAAARHGRAASQIKFDKLESEEAERWLKNRGIDPSSLNGNMPRQLCDLYAALAGKNLRKLQGSGLGFR